MLGGTGSATAAGELLTTGRAARRAGAIARWTGRSLGALWGMALLAAVGVFGALALRADRIDVVLSGSMSPTIPAGSLVVTSSEPVAIGDVVVYDHASTGRLVTHRVVGLVAGSGTVRYRTKGDANPTEDADPVPTDDVRGVVIAHVPELGRYLRALDGPAGAAVLMSPPLVAGLAGAASGLVRHRDLRNNSPSKERIP